MGPDVVRQRIERVLAKKARDVMKVGIKTVTSTATVYDAVTILITRDITGLPVTEEGKVVGIVTEKDILNLIVRPGKLPGPVGHHMTTEVVTFDEDDGVPAVLDCLVRNHFRRVPIQRRGQLAGIISRADLIRACLKTFRAPSAGKSAELSTSGATARELMTPGLLTIAPQASILEAMHMLVTHGITGLPVVDDRMDLVGIVSEKDLMQLLCDPDVHACRVEDLMSRDLTTFEAETEVFDICDCLANSRFRRVPIVEQGRLVGIISRSDLIMFILKNPSIIASGRTLAVQ